MRARRKVSGPALVIYSVRPVPGAHAPVTIISRQPLPADVVSPAVMSIALPPVVSVTGAVGPQAPGDAWAELEPEPEVSSHHEAAFAAIEAGDFDGAAAAYERALAEDPAALFPGAGANRNAAGLVAAE